MDVKSSARAALSHHALSGISRQHLAELVAELVPAWEAQQESAPRERRGGDRRREAGAGPKHRLVFVDRVPATLAHLRHDLPQSALAALSGVDRSTVSAAIRQVRPLPAARGFAVPDQPDGEILGHTWELATDSYPRASGAFRAQDNVRCPAGHDVFQVVVAYALAADGRVRRLSVGLRCPTDGALLLHLTNVPTVPSTS
ncbi:transposase family protein [Kitasatospora sp. NPDC093558]|uniref:transposase family protein n=1 Tax=Kitasatospora sp. NPDC093558 TaxID=3155201 RepID=UPI003432DE78